MCRYLYLPFVMLALISVSATTEAGTVYDLKSDWDSVNSGGQWSLNYGSTPLSYCANLSTTGLDTWTITQPGWNRSGDITPAWFCANGTCNTTGRDWLAGDIVVHTSRDDADAANVTWTSTIDGTVDISGAVWAGRDIGRSNNWYIYLNDTLLTSGNVCSGDAYSRADPFTFDLGSGGASALQDVAVSVGDVLQLKFLKAASGGEDYVGMSFTIDATPVPEPSTFVLLLCLGIGLLVRFRRK